jgi:hypothetical protein
VVAIGTGDFGTIMRRTSFQRPNIKVTFPLYARSAAAARSRIADLRELTE